MDATIIMRDYFGDCINCIHWILQYVPPSHCHAVLRRRDGALLEKDVVDQSAPGLDEALGRGALLLLDANSLLPVRQRGRDDGLDLLPHL